MISHAFNITHEAFRRIWLLVGLILALATSIFGQSTLQEFPTPVTSNQISGTINARPIGDSRLTTYFYTFDGSQGDVFVNVSTKNFNGDFDIFIADGLRPLSKIITLSGFGEYETGRVIYLRKPERLLLRVQGRTPDDEPATFQIKFAGSFVALNEGDLPSAPELPTVSRPDRIESGVRADSRKIPDRTVDTETVDSAKVAVPATDPVDERPVAAREVPQRAEREIEPTRSETANRRGTVLDRPPEKRVEADKSVVAPRILNLVVEFFDGSRIETPMTEIRRFTVDEGRLTIIGSNGRSRRYSMNDVLKVSIE